MKHTWTIALALLTLTTAGCLNTRNRRFDRRDSVEEVAAQTSDDKPVIDREKLEDFFFDYHWDSYIPNEVFLTMTVQGDHIYVFTDKNRLYQIDLNGQVRWVFDVDAPLDFQSAENPIGIYVYAPEDIKSFGRYNEVFFVAEDVLYALDMDSGSELWRKRLRFAVSSPPAASLTHVFVGGWDDRIYAVNKDTQDIDWFYRTDGDIRARPTAERDAAYLASADGTAYRLDLKGKVTWPFTSERKIVVDPFLNAAANLLYVASDDYSLYVIGTLDGRVEWEHETGGRPLAQPVSIDDQVYLPSLVERVSQTEVQTEPVLYAYQRKGRVFNKTQHEVLWERKGATRYLASGVDDVYVLEPSTDDSANIAKLDKKEGFFRDSFRVAGADFWGRNSFDPRTPEGKFHAGIVFVGYRNGWIIALKERPRR